MKTKELKGILDRIGAWPQDAQEELVRSIAEIEARYTNVYRLDDDEQAALKRSGDDMRAGRFASDEEVAQVFDRYRRS